MRRPAKRSYDASNRQAAAHETRRAILASARRSFCERGYAATTMGMIAEGAGVSLDTVYASAGKKPQILRLLVETALSGEDDAVPAEQRDYVRAIRAEPNAERKLEIYASALRALQPRLAPIFEALQAAAQQDKTLAALWGEISKRRAANMRLFVQDLMATGAVRSDLSLDQAADIVWSMNSPEFWQLLVRERGWTPEAFETWLADAWRRLLLAPHAGRRA